MGTWSITPTPHPLISISTSGEVTVQRHESTTTYTINYTPDADECSGTVLTKTLTVYACDDSCTCETVGGLSVPAEASATEVQVGTYSNSSSCPAGASWSVTGLKSGTNFLTGFRFANNKIYAKVNVDNPNASTRTAQYNVSYGSCTDYFSVTQNGKSTPIVTTYSYTLASNITGATVIFNIAGSSQTKTTDANGYATATSATLTNATVTISKTSSQPNERYFFQYGGSVTISGNSSKRVDGGMLRVNQTADAPVLFTMKGWLSSDTSLNLTPTNVNYGAINLSSWIKTINFVSTTSGSVRIQNTSIAEKLTSGTRTGTFTLVINGISTNQTINVKQGNYPE